MKLRKEIDIPAFMKAVSSCKGDVIFDSGNGDALDLKSELCRYIFFTVEADEKLRNTGMIQCSLNEDYEKLKDYLQQM
ncbi:MAG: hypothetical protein Q4B22_09750 [Eubacteriales bacterium]|nr:hypothetical protein [Eubacteriales bacterium]